MSDDFYKHERCPACSAPPITVEELESILRRRRAAADPSLWQVGGPGGRTLYEGDRFVGSTVDPADAVRLAAANNRAREERAGR